MEVRMRNMKSGLSRRRSPATIWSCLIATSLIASTATASWDGGSVLNQLQQIPLIYLPSPLRKELSDTSHLPDRDHEFSLRHIIQHGTYDYPDVHVRMDVRQEDEVQVLGDDGKEVPASTPMRIRSKGTVIQRLADRRVERMQALYMTARENGVAASLGSSEWVMDDLYGPNTSDKETVINLAKMSWNAYTDVPWTGEWQDVGHGFNHSQGFGWENDNLRGHIFANQDNSTIIIALKGTSPGMLFFLF